jgi:hypothetical protein
MPSDYFELRARDVKPTMWIIAGLSLLFLSADKLGDLIKFVK